MKCCHHSVKCTSVSNNISLIKQVLQVSFPWFSCWSDNLEVQGQGSPLDTVLHVILLVTLKLTLYLTDMQSETRSISAGPRHSYNDSTPGVHTCKTPVHGPPRRQQAETRPECRPGMINLGLAHSLGAMAEWGCGFVVYCSKDS